MKKIKFTQEQFIENCKKVHGDKYDYSKAVYVDCFTHVIIICKEHGEFKQTPLSHYNSKQGCPYCSGNVKKTIEQIIQEFKSIHGDKYDYSKVDYKNTHKKVIIICKEHGEFEQTPHNHLLGWGCKLCSGVKKLTTEEFIKKAKQIHGDKYDYSKTDYQGAFKKVIIICPKHGEFEQVARAHIMKEKQYGCPQCKMSKGEIKVREFLNKNTIEYIPQKRFKNCKNKTMLPFDFYILKKNICIEFQGEQHYNAKKFFGGEDGYKQRKINDKIKKDFCKNNGITLIRIKYNKNIDSILTRHLLK
jgi:very-short-patch-repair endonuclease/ribosomal protein L36